VVLCYRKLWQYNVLISALNAREKEVVWFDHRKGIEELLSEIAKYGDRLLGMVVNFPTKKLLGICGITWTVTALHQFVLGMGKTT
jgi:hypothetical protein